MFSYGAKALISVVQQHVLTLDPASCGCHRKEDRRGDALHEDAIHEDIYVTE